METGTTISTAPSRDNLLERKFNLRMVNGRDHFKLVHLRWSGVTWAFLVILLFFLLFIYKSMMIDMLWLKLTVLTFCLGLAAILVFGLLTQAYDGVVIANGRLAYRYGLARRSFLLAQITDIQTRTDVLRYKDDGEARVSVTLQLWLRTTTGESRIFDLHGAEPDIPRMEELGEQIKAAMFQRIR